MNNSAAEKQKISERISAAVSSGTPIRTLASNFSKTARTALDEAIELIVEEIDIHLDRLPKRMDGLRIVHLSDIHHSPFTDLHHIDSAVERANALEPDLIFLTGDFVSHGTDYINPMARTVGRLEAKQGLYACLGNHDHWTDAGLVAEALNNEGINVLVNAGQRISFNDSSFWLCGVDDLMAGETDIPASLDGSYEDEMKIMLAHNPAILKRAEKSGIDLIFSGHTHGGQVKLRDKETKKRGKRKLSSGLHQKNDTQIYITRGIGTVVLPIRYQCPPEISLVNLYCK